MSNNRWIIFKAAQNESLVLRPRFLKKVGQVRRSFFLFCFYSIPY